MTPRSSSQARYREICPDVFSLDEEGHGFVAVPDIEPGLAAPVQEAADNFPERAIVRTLKRNTTTVTGRRADPRKLDSVCSLNGGPRGLEVGDGASGAFFRVGAAATPVSPHRGGAQDLHFAGRPAGIHRKRRCGREDNKTDR
ncbi:hypothetical protein FAGKG844_360038 [Frankia sp. AgKG'84/4]